MYTLPSLRKSNSRSSAERGEVRLVDQQRSGACDRSGGVNIDAGVKAAEDLLVRRQREQQRGAGDADGEQILGGD